MTKLPQKSELRTLGRALLGRAPGFRDCQAATLDTLIAAGEIRSLRNGELLVQRGKHLDAMCMVLDGSMESSITRLDGHRQLLSYLKAGDLVGIIGIIGLFDGLGHVADLRARRPATVMLIPGSVMRSLRDVHPEVIRACEYQIAFRSRLLYDRLAADASLPVEVRLGHLLITFTSLYGLPRGTETLLDMKLSQADLADSMGVSRQRVNLAIKALQDLGLIRVRYSTVTIVDREALVLFTNV